MTTPAKKKHSAKKTAVKKASANKKGAGKKSVVKKQGTTGSSADNKPINKQMLEKDAVKSENKTKPDKTINPTQKDNVFVLKSNLAINEAAMLHKTLSELSESGEPVVFDASDVEMIDTAIFQLLLAFVLTVKRNEISVGWLKSSAVFLERAEILGLTEALCLIEESA